MGGGRRALRAGIIGGVITAAFGLLLAGPFLLTHRQDFPGERFYGDLAVTAVARLGGGDAKNPFPANDEKALKTGRDAFTGSCAVCHGSTGDGRGLFGGSSYPEATDLRSDIAKRKSDAELFWITRNGLSFSAMPSFAKQFKDEDLWAIVTYVRSLQQGTAKPVSIAAPTQAQLAFADPHGSPAARGAAVYFAQGCDRCHGAAGVAPGNLDIVGRPDTEVVRTPSPGMPKYDTERITDAELDDLLAYMLTFPRR